MGLYIDFAEWVSVDIDRKKHTVKFDVGEIVGREKGILFLGDDNYTHLCCNIPFKSQFRYCGNPDNALKCTITLVDDVQKYIPGMYFIDEHNCIGSTDAICGDEQRSPYELYRLVFVGYDEEGNSKYVKKGPEYNPGIFYHFLNLRFGGKELNEVKMIFPLVWKDFY